MHDGDHVNSKTRNHYLSAAAFGPKREGLPPFRIFDLDVDSLETIKKDYASVIQNLRLIKRPGENRWSKQDRKWSEAALGEDSAGRVLFIYSRTAFSMHEFNEILVQLPIGLQCAQHLEGGPEAQLYVKSGDVEIEVVGSFETGFFDNDTNLHAWPIPNVIGISRKKK
jgi:hypothetical protein